MLWVFIRIPSVRTEENYPSIIIKYPHLFFCDLADKDAQLLSVVQQ